MWNIEESVDTIFKMGGTPPPPRALLVGKIARFQKG